jgi:hypothetical protein
MVSLHDTTFVQTKKWNFLQPQQPWRSLGAHGVCIHTVAYTKNHIYVENLSNTQLYEYIQI